MERELIERLRKSGFIDYAAMGEAADLIESLRAQLDEARKALEPFASIGGAWVDADGWNDFACKNDRVCDWFGPSDFRRAALLSVGREALEKESEE